METNAKPRPVPPSVARAEQIQRERDAYESGLAEGRRLSFVVSLAWAVAGAMGAAILYTVLLVIGGGRL